MRILSKVLIIVLLAVFFRPLRAQDDFQKWLKKDQHSFRKYLDEQDRAFTDFLKKDWEAYRSFTGLVRDAKPKPKKMPVANEQEKSKFKPPKPLPKVKNIPIPLPKSLPKPRPKPIVTQGAHPLKFSYLGLKMVLNYKKDFKLNLNGSVNNQIISAAWGNMASSRYKSLLEQLLAYRKKMLLNDWGYVILVRKVVAKSFPASLSKRNLFSWFLLVKSGYDAKVAYQNARVFLLLPSQNIIYGTRFVTLDKRKYYFILPAGNKLDLSGSVYTYKGRYQNAKLSIGLNLKRIPQILDKDRSRKLRFRFKGKQYVFTVAYDVDVVNYFKNYPQTELSLYFEAPVSSVASYSLLSLLKPHIQGKSEVDAVNFLLRFVQTAFAYKTDQQQFGKEKYLMPEETIYYPASDCEDRSILFSYLVHNLLGLQVVGLTYPGHVSTAIHFDGTIPGDAVTYKGKRFVVCDPTYINADAGMAMPQFKTVAPKVIVF